MKTTPLSFLLDNMNIYRDMANLEDQYKVRAIDSALRSLRQGTNFPWNLKKGTLKVFDGVTEYPIASDHDELGYIDKQSINQYEDTARFYNTSLQQFYEKVNATRNLMADIWKNGTRLIGLNYKDFSVGSNQLNDAEVLSDFTVSGDASGAVLDEVTYKEGSGSIQFNVTSSTGTATIVNSIDSFSETNYKKFYHFKLIYLDAVPTSIELRLRTDASNYLATSGITTQFDGTPFVADDWNLIAHDLNSATETGTFDETAIASEAVILTGAATGVYRIDASYLREWQLMDYWYYSTYNVATLTSSVADKEFFIGVTQSASDISTTDRLIGEPKWFDKILWDAMRILLGDIPNNTLLALVQEKKAKADKDFDNKYPNITPLTTTKRYNFSN